MAAPIKHGQRTRTYKSKEYAAWDHMKGRCTNPKDRQYPNYGARGITICESWMKFENFYRDMGAAPSRYHSLDRIDVDGNYEPDNCRWATDSEQQNNRTNNNLIEYNGKIHTLSEWSRILNIPKTTISGRLKRGVAIDDVLKG